MPEKDKKPEFVVTDRRLFSSDGELRQEVVEDEERRAEREREKHEAQERANEERASQHPAAPPGAEAPGGMVDDTVPPAPTAAEQEASADAYRESTRKLDYRIEKELRKQGQAHRAQDFEITFDKFSASLYMTALMQLGLAAPQGEKPTVDLIGARQTIDTLSLLQAKTKGNLTASEETMLQNLLYELRMAYLEVTNLLTRPPQNAPGADGKIG